MQNLIQLLVSDDTCVRIAGEKLSTRDDVAQVLQGIREQNPQAIVSIESDSSQYYKAIGMAIYGAHFAGFSGENLCFSIDGKV